ncbi:MAG: hypothetical protein K6G40_04490 [Eubacterium sp.]|nr:hypothetical protein [Eubacterium sp.]
MDEKIIEMMEEYAADRIRAVAENMLEDGCGYSFISRYTGLSEDEIKAIKGTPEPAEASDGSEAPRGIMGEYEENLIRAEAMRDGAYSVIYDFIDHGMITEEDGANYFGIPYEKFHKRYVINQK